jgi:hypothetical protein
MNEADHELSGVWARPQRSLTVGLLLTISATAFEALAVATVLPATVADLGGLGFYGWVFSGFMLCNLVSIAVSGRWRIAGELLGRSWAEVRSLWLA